ncbi:hypothetical protein CCACVL1_21703 [Corchorus capsularis]|uniref:Gnk2-homologous domain-containing protein n=1 Tax=Corchorus capsularis TaxID=210143 RepID=A0A1R3H2F4_COCAP|nr:hypothetical protein CCACVL1_21703 [Corchorus capsularis]
MVTIPLLLGYTRGFSRKPFIFYSGQATKTLSAIQLAKGVKKDEETFLAALQLDEPPMEKEQAPLENSTYEANLDSLLSSFSSSNTPNDHGFYSISSGGGQGSDVANAIALCRGDVNSGACLECINTSTTELRNRCPNQREAIIWYDNCMLRYTNRSIFGVVETNPAFFMWNANNVTNVDVFNQALSDLLDRLISNASSGNSLGKFATGNYSYSAFQKLYALVQCTPDLTALSCSSCLSQAVTLIPQCCDRKQGGRVVSPSCYLRFESYDFYDPTAADTPLLSPPPPAPPTPEPPLSLPPSNDTTTTIGMTFYLSALFYQVNDFFLLLLPFPCSQDRGK